MIYYKFIIKCIKLMFYLYQQLSNKIKTTLNQIINLFQLCVLFLKLYIIIIFAFLIRIRWIIVSYLKQFINLHSLGTNILMSSLSIFFRFTGDQNTRLLILDGCEQ